MTGEGFNKPENFADVICCTCPLTLMLRTKVVNRILPCRRTVVEVDGWEMSLGSTILTGRARAEVAAAMVPVPYEPELSC